MRLRPLHLLGAFLIALVLLAPGINTPFIKDAEPQSAQWIVDIVQHDRWLLPVDYYGFVDRKPPLYYWLAASAAELTGRHVDPVRARAVSLIAAAVAAAVLLAWCLTWINPATAWLAFFFLLGSYGFASRATTALTDMLMTALIFAVYCLIYPALDQRISVRRTLAAGVLLGFAILTKGPVAAVLLAFALVIYLLLERRNPLALAKRGWPWAILLIGCAIAVAWYVPAFIAGRRDDLAGVFLSENFGHFMPAAAGGTGEAARPIYYIAVRLFGAMLPLTLLTPALVLAFWRDPFAPTARKPLRYQLAMALAVLLFFSAASAKRDDYILPAIPPLAIVFAALFAATQPAPHAGPRAFVWSRDLIAAAVAISLAAATLLLLALGGAQLLSDARAGLQSSDAAYAAIFLHGFLNHRWPFLGAIIAALAGCAVILLGLRRSRALHSGVGLAVIGLAGCLLWNGVLRPREAASRSVGPFAQQVRRQIGAAPLFVAYFDPEFAWYYGLGVPPLPRSIARAGVADGRPIFFVARPHELTRLSPAVRRRLRPIITSTVRGGGGPPALYEIPPTPASTLNRTPQTAK